ncbi:MAG: hypothetical protein AVDCRST_MAG70-522 [uncultured Thermomicrobiales bacterium]|uniref:HTH marR-type domain-containing protein n=1 Tax=uncultured Thermomicrobiales bacterium TaxID=1645740 RepID=A0A6J4UBQ6_9BACT|nr:MAG: hypothetical protein AVDCRST_MAG70-522 [uncultured Thermomicrobiales bacterium]
MGGTNRHAPDMPAAVPLTDRAYAPGGDPSGDGAGPIPMAGGTGPPTAGVESGATCTGIWQALRLAHDRVARRLAIDLDRACGLAVNEFDVLWHLRTCPAREVRVGALSDVVALSQPAISRLVSRLEGRGLVSRAGASADGRVCVVRLTAAGAALVERATETYAHAIHDTLGPTGSDEDHAALLRALARIGG